ncbi:uncharacterized [Tachysurus ichikawai]
MPLYIFYIGSEFGRRTESTSPQLPQQQALLLSHMLPALLQLSSPERGPTRSLCGSPAGVGYCFSADLTAVTTFAPCALDCGLIQSLSMFIAFENPFQNVRTGLATMQRREYSPKCTRSAAGYGVVALHMCRNLRWRAGKVGSKVRQPWGHHGPNRFGVVLLNI